MRNNNLIEALRGQPKAQEVTPKAFDPTTGESGGYLLTEEQLLEVRELVRQYGGLGVLADVIPVKATKGSILIEKAAVTTGFKVISEDNPLPPIESPQWVNVIWSTTDKGGLLPVPSNLMADSPVAYEYLKKWLGKKAAITRNKAVYDLLYTLPKVPVADWDGLKSIFNTSLNPAIMNSGVIVMNQDAYNMYDQMKTADGVYQMDQWMKDQKKEILILSNDLLPTVANKAPIIIGDVAEAVKVFENNFMAIASKHDMNANEYILRAINTEDQKLADSSAVIFAEVEVVDAASMGVFEEDTETLEDEVEEITTS